VWSLLLMVGGGDVQGGGSGGGRGKTSPKFDLFPALFPETSNC
jgi:hypothetical protein